VNGVLAVITDVELVIMQLQSPLVLIPPVTIPVVGTQVGLDSVGETSLMETALDHFALVTAREVILHQHRQDATP